MKRSGNHAIVNWILAQGQFVFFNNVIPVASILTGRKRMPRPKAFNRWLLSQLKDQNVVAVLTQLWQLRSRDLIVSLEDHELNVMPFYSAPAPVEEILILREPANLFASRIRKASQTDNPAYACCAGEANDRAVALWKLHASAFVNQETDSTKRIVILYDAWCQSGSYRKELSNQLGLRFTDKGMGSVPSDGGGSSFEGTAFDGRAHEMAVTKRAEMLGPIERDFLDSILADKEMAALAMRLQEHIEDIAGRSE
jgi:hypothetical protein